jgi:hypothetical protein
MELIEGDTLLFFLPTVREKLSCCISGPKGRLRLCRCTGPEMETEPVFKPGNTRLLFSRGYTGGYVNNIPWDIHPDGKRFLMIKEPEAAVDESSAEAAAAPLPREIHIVVNWFEELKRRAPVE